MMRIYDWKASDMIDYIVFLLQQITLLPVFPYIIFLSFNTGVRA
jgi:hypothetical protein